ncbi:MAG: RsmB/NOP family class I SAM-dependent RNA methyltransferase [Dongiaceae bacterium]
MGLSPGLGSARSRPLISARTIALDLLQSVFDRLRPLDEAIERHDGWRRLDSRDRAFARALAATTLRRVGQIDRVIDQCLNQPLPARAGAIRQLLRLGVCQLLYLETPAHAAVDATVGMLDGRGGEAGFKGLVNAVLRRTDREREELLKIAADLSINVPPWLWQTWVGSYGAETAERIVAAHLLEPPLDISVKHNIDEWARTLGAIRLPTGSLRRNNAGPIEELPGFAAGEWWVQDAAAALPARLLGDVVGKSVIDLCAAPGGKTAQLAAAGAIVMAVDRSPARLRRLAENLTRLKLGAEIIEADGLTWQPAAPADAVLIDAPCSSTGTIRRNPDIAWLKRPEDIAKQASLQDRLLSAAIAMVRSGGVIVYCTCSLQPAEGIERIDLLLKSDAPVERMPITAAEVGDQPEFISANGDLRTMPYHLGELGGLDGFYAARLRRC